MTDESRYAAQADPPTATADSQDPLPEATWGWRRAFVFAMATAICVQLYLISGRVKDHDDAYWWTLALLWFVILCYLVAPSAEQIIRLIQVAKLMRGGGTLEKTATSETSQGRAETRTTMTAGSGSPEPVPTPPEALTGSGGAGPTEAAEPPEDAQEDPSWPHRG